MVFELITRRIMLELRFGGDMVSTWVVKLKEHAGALVDLVKNEQPLVANDNYAFAA